MTTAMVFADSHAHLDFPDYQGEWEQIFLAAQQAGVGYVTTVGTRLAGAETLCAMASRFPNLYATVGVHPHHAKEEPITVEEILAHCDHPKVVAIGESGLDFHYDFSPRPQQEANFRAHIRAAHIADLPLIVHTREAEEATRAILDDEGIPGRGGVIHCFTGTKEMAEWALARGFHLSFSGVLTFRTAQPLREIAAQVPLDRILIETDSPYLAPVPFRGKRNVPAHVVYVARTLAECRQTPLSEIASATTENYKRLFRIDSHPVPEGSKAPLPSATLAYTIGNSLYLNVTRGCTLRCRYCPKWQDEPLVHHYDLTLHRNPTAAELIAAMGEVGGYDEVVFCGFGEPTLRLAVILDVAADIKRRGGKRVRLNTDGLANLVHRRDVTPAFCGLIDAVSVSLTAQDQTTYDRLCQPALAGSYQGVLDFLRVVQAHVPHVTATAIDGAEGVDIAACRKIAEVLGVHFRVRLLNRLG
ncbi:MAG: YchF/TatD family DNA exonuclease [Magnetococcales bacterium]|nr:YchF/TatD family DNA exonuclease [Magnetococcales bacterium]